MLSEKAAWPLKLRKTTFRGMLQFEIRPDLKCFLVDCNYCYFFSIFKVTKTTKFSCDVRFFIIGRPCN